MIRWLDLLKYFLIDYESLQKVNNINDYHIMKLVNRLELVKE